MLVLSLVMFVPVADAQVRLDITRGRVEPMPIAITVFPRQFRGNRADGQRRERGDFLRP